MKRCCGITKNLRRCQRLGEWKLFRDDHKRQPFVWIFILIFTVISGAIGIYSGILGVKAINDENNASKTHLKLSLSTSESPARIIPLTNDFLIIEGSKINFSELQGYVFVPISREHTNMFLDFWLCSSSSNVVEHPQ